LNTGAYIWDLSGNVEEWVKDTNTTTFGANSSISLLTAATRPTLGIIGGVSETAKYHFGTAHDWSTVLTATPWGGFGNSFLTVAGGGITSGGNFNNGTGDAGLFMVYLGSNRTTGGVTSDFRCVWTTP
jgi:hypothetical protein